MTPEPDPRRGVPSGSGLERADACPPSFKLERIAAERGLAPDAGEDAASGDRVHRFLETRSEEDWNLLSPAEKETGEKCEDQAWGIARDWGATPDKRHAIELRLGLTPWGKAVPVLDDGNPVEFIVTGKSDETWIGGDRGLVIDFKTGRGEVEEAVRNAQLRCYAVLAALRWDLSHVRVAIIQPLAGAPSIADYGPAELEAAHEWLLTVSERASEIQVGFDGEEVTGEGKALLSAGRHCHYCDAQLICPAFKAAGMAALAPVSPATLPAASTKEAIFARVHEMDAGVVRSILSDPRRKMLKWLDAAVTGVAIKMLRADPKSLPGYELREKAGVRKIEDTETASHILTRIIDSEAILRCSSLRPAKLEEEIQIASGKKTRTRYNITKKEAKETLRDMLSDLMAVKTKTVIAETGEMIEDEEED